MSLEKENSGDTILNFKEDGEVKLLPNQSLHLTAGSCAAFKVLWFIKVLSCSQSLVVISPQQVSSIVCAGHVTELVGWKSPRQVFAEPKARRRARAPSCLRAEALRRASVRRGLKEAQSESAGRRTGTGYEV